MPNCFSFTRKDRPEDGPVGLNAIDREMCEHFQKPCHETNWYMDWYNLAGFSIACGKKLPELIEEQEKICKEYPEEQWYKDYLAVLKWLDDNFTSDAWYSPR